MSHRHASRCWRRCFGLWASIGTSGAVSGSILAAGLTRSAPIPLTRAPSIAAIFPPTCCRPDAMTRPTPETFAANFPRHAAGLLPVQPQFSFRALRQPEPAPKVVTFGIHRLLKRTDTVSETASENSKMIVENGGGLKRINLDFTGVFAILLELNRTLQVPAGRRKSIVHSGRVIIADALPATL